LEVSGARKNTDKKVSDIVIVIKNVLPLAIVGVLGLGIIWVVYKMFTSKKNVLAPIVPIHVPSGPVHAAPRVVGSKGTISSAAHRMNFSNQYSPGSYAYYQ
jgi:hypothetical protein